MSLKRDVWVLPALRAQAVAPFLRALAPHFALLSGHDLRLRLEAQGRLVVLLPRAEDATTLDPVRGRLAQAFVAAGRAANELDNLPLQQRDLADEPALAETVLAFIWQLVITPLVTAQQAGDADATEQPLRAIIAATSAETHVSAFAAIVRRSRDARFFAGDGQVTLLDLDDDPSRGATLLGLRASGLPQGVCLLRRHSLAAMSIWLPEDKAFAEEDLDLVSELLNGLADASIITRAGDLHLLADATGAGQLIWLPPDPAALQNPVIPTDASELAKTISGPDLADELGPALRFSRLTVRPDIEAQKALNARLNDRRFPLGYKISLAQIPEISRSEEDIERLRAEIEEREARIALIQAMGRRQLRLLRFSDAQLPALVDGLRKMPRALREEAGLFYAATHAAGRAEPVHYVYYDPERVQFEGMLPEFYWRAVTDDSPIAFWLDPHAEEARNDNPAEPMVFVPQGARILPYIDSFGSSVTGTLRLVLGNLFADGSAVLDAPGARPAFVFGGNAGGRDEIAVDLIDLNSFAPLRVSLRWINEHILASSPRTAGAEERRELAETLYAGQLARDLRKTMRDEVDALKLSWEQAQVELLHCFDRLTDAVASEVRQTRAKLETARQFTAMSKARLVEVTQAVNGLGMAVGSMDADLNAMADSIPALGKSRIAFFERYQAEHDSSELLIQNTRDEIASLTARMQALMLDLRR